MAAIPSLLFDRQLKRFDSTPNLYSSAKFVADLDLTHQLFGHTGCVNALCWSDDGVLLASGSDDTHVNVYTTEFPAYPLVTRFETGHTKNIFSTKFMPNSSNSVIVTAAGDCQIRVFDLNNGGATKRDVFRSFSDRVKRIVPDGVSSNTFLSCSEDGDVRHFDLRSPEPFRLSPSDAPPPLLSYSKQRISLNALTLSPIQPQYFVVGGTHSCLFLHDRRFIARDVRETWGVPTDPEKNTQCVRMLCPNNKMGNHVTSAKFSNFHPNDVIGSWSADDIYMFDIRSSDSSSRLARLDTLSENEFKYNPPHISRGFDSNARRRDELAQAHDDDGDRHEEDEPLLALEFIAIYKNLTVNFFIIMDYPKCERLAAKLLSYFDAITNLDWHQESVYRAVISMSKFASLQNGSIDIFNDSEVKINDVPMSQWSLRYNLISCIFQHAFAPRTQPRTFTVPDQSQFRVGNQHRIRAPTVSRRPSSFVAPSEANVAAELARDVESRELSNSFWKNILKALIKREASKFLEGTLIAAFGKNDQACGSLELNDDDDDDEHSIEAERSNSGEESPTIDFDSDNWSILSDPDSYPLSDSEVFDENLLEYYVSTFNDSDSESDVFTEDYGAPWLRYTSRERQESTKFDSIVPTLNPLLKYHGHCNVETVKDVNFFGARDEYIISGSDCGNLFIWKKKTGRIVQILEADTEIVNIVQPHPQIPQIAASGINSTIKIYSPFSMDYSPDKYYRFIKDNNRTRVTMTRGRPRNIVLDGFDTSLGQEGSETLPEDDYDMDLESESKTFDDDSRKAEGKMLAPRKILGLSRQKINQKIEVMMENEANVRQGVSDTRVTRHILADIARFRQARLQAATADTGGDCVIA
ncbi:WD40-repeat-containing domain protein [Lipomyces japonicus]|uniref:WD40-repeat-containing domain protein n=1 Tax=Lipomyces japonicus TaxID=56871 RepID=UPI0034CD324A